jgi:hypothetical protein
VRDGQVLSHPGRPGRPALRPSRAPGRGSRGLAQLTGPAETADLIDQLRATGTVLTYDPDARTLRADGRYAPSVTIGKYR